LQDIIYWKVNAQNALLNVKEFVQDIIIAVCATKDSIYKEVAANLVHLIV
jgi:hypothetical protein